MSCKTTEVELLPITTHETKIIDGMVYDIESKTTPNHVLEEIKDKTYWFLYCISYRDPSLPEWILARWYWNDQWVWTPDWIFPM